MLVSMKNLRRSASSRAQRTCLRSVVERIGYAAFFVLPALLQQSFAQVKRPTDYHGATGEPARVRFVRNMPSIVQELTLAPEATLLWKRIQRLIEDPHLESLSTTLDMLDLQVTLPMDEVDRNKPGAQFREDLKDARGLIKRARYGIAISSGPYPKKRYFILNLDFNTESICLSKQEIQRVFSTQHEQNAVHSPYVLWPDKTGTAHGFGLTDSNAGFSIAASGCATSFGMNKDFEIIEKQP